MFSLFLDVVDRIDNKLNSLQEQIDSLETRFSTYEKKETKNKINPFSPPPSPSPTPTCPPPSPSPSPTPTIIC